MAKQTPIPQNPIGESFVWRDWFQKLSDRVFGSAAGIDVPIQPEYGGTGITTYNKGDIIYSNATDNLTRLAAPAATSVLQMTALGVPSWTIASTGTVTSVGGTGTVSGLTLSGTVTSSGNLTLGGTLDLSSPPAIGSTTPAAGTFTTLIGGKDQTNYGQLTGGATTKAVEFVTLGTDTNIAAVIKSKGTGAIDLAAGSRGVNISNGGTVTAITRTAGGTGYTSSPTVAISAPTTAGGVQATATVAVSAGAITTFTITNAGSGYVEQPTVSFSGGGGSGAAAYATVGSSSSIKHLGGSLGFSGSSGEVFRIYDFGGQAGVGVRGHTLSGGIPPAIFPTPSNGSQTNISFEVASLGTGAIQLSTNGGISAGAFNQIRQLNVAHTASAVNYVQVTGAATTVAPQITAQGSDTNIAMVLSSKGTSDLQFRTNNSGQVQFQVLHTASAVNRPTATGAIAGAAPVIGVAGTDTNIDLTLTPKGTGNVRFGTYTATISAITGYIEIKDSGGTVRRLAVVA